MNCNRIDLMLTRAQIFIALLLIFIVAGMTVLLILYHGEMSSTVVTIVSSVLAQLVAAMMVGVGFFLSRQRPHTPSDPTPADLSLAAIPTSPVNPALTKE